MAEEKPGRTAGAMETTGDLRALLADAMTRVANGTMDAAQADEIIKLARMIHQSINDEIRLGKAGTARGATPAEFGKTRLPNAG